MPLAVRCRLTAALTVALLVPCACSGQTGPPRHPIGTIAARLESRLDLIDLVVSDAARAARVRRIYLQAWEIGHEFDVDRARALVEASSLMAARKTPEAQSQPGSSSRLEGLLAPPLAVSRRAYDRYAALMLEARGQLTAAEFERLSSLR